MPWMLGWQMPAMLGGGAVAGLREQTQKSCSVFTLPLRRAFNKTGDNEPPVITGRQHCPLRGGNWKLHLQIALKIKSFYRNHSPFYFHFPRFRKMIVLGLLGCFLTLLEATIFPLVLLCPIFFTLKNGVKHESWRCHLYEQWQSTRHVLQHTV